MIKKSQYILNVLKTESLKQSLANISSHVIASTIHGAKGLEWDYVIFQNFDFPNYMDLCDSKLYYYLYNNRDTIDSNDLNTEKFQEVLNKLCVAISRAKNMYILHIQIGELTLKIRFCLPK